MRITGLATGIDMDEIVSSTMKAYRIKIDKKTQSKDVLEIKQQLYRDIISEASKFYDKYFDVTKSDNLLRSSNYTSVVYKSSSDAVTVIGNSEAKKDNYTVEVQQLATAAKAIVEKDKLSENSIININGQEFVLTGKDEKERVKNLNDSLQKAGINVTARYSDMAGTNVSGMILESKILGENSTFTVGTESYQISVTNGSDAESAKGEFTLANLSGKQIKIGEQVINIEVLDENSSNSEIKTKLNNQLKDSGIKVQVDEDGKITLTANKSFSVDGNDYEYTPAMPAISDSKSIDDISSKTLQVNGKLVQIGELHGLSNEQIKLEIDKQLEGTVVKVNVNEDGAINFESTSKGSSSKLNLSILNNTSSGISATVSNGENAIAIITNNTTGGVFEYKDNSNTVTVDGATFTFNEKTTIDNPVKITGTSDVKDIKNKLVDFINDYNTLIEKLNTLTLTKHNRNYSPLTADQKKEMSETEIKLWNEKVKEGQLYKDSNLTRITNSLKESMRTLMESSGLNLESIGIIPVKDYSGSKNGTFTIDEEKLTQALQENSEDVMNLFIKSAPSKEELNNLSSEDQIKRKNQTGILYKLKDILYSEFKSSTSLLSKKAGIEGTSTFSNNELTKSIWEYENKIKDMEKDFAIREQALYTKYATLETMMNKLNSQQSSLQSMFG